jgi:hypothetical protein
LEYLAFHHVFSRIFWQQDSINNNDLQTLFALACQISTPEVNCSRSDNETLNAPACKQTHYGLLPSPASPFSMSLHISHFRWLVNGCRNDQSVAAENFCKSPYTGCVIRRVTLPVRAHFKPGCQCSISNIAMLCSSPVRCGRLKIAPESIQALERYCRY